jgi:hypothetical protein
MNNKHRGRIATDTGGGRSAGGLRVSDSDLVEFLDGVSDEATDRRLVTAALADVHVRHRLSALIALDRRASDNVAAAGHEAGAAAESRLGEAMRRAIFDVAAETAGEVRREPEIERSAVSVLRHLLFPEAPGERASGGLLPVAAARGAASVAESLHGFLEAAGALATRILITGRHTLALPCLAPAAAATAADLQMRRETITTGDGVRIEFQQLPGGLARLRVFVDASQIGQEVEESGYNVAFLTLEDSGSAAGLQGEARSVPADRHILVVSLNAQGRGFTDFVVGAAAEAGATPLPAPHGLCRLTGVTLSHIAAG